MEISDLKTGTKLELELDSDTPRDRSGKLISKLQVKRKGSMMIDAPYSGATINPLHVGVGLYVYFVKRSKSQIDLYRFRARVTGREQAGNLLLLQIVAEGEIQMVQRRQFYRLEYTLPVRYRLVGEKDCENSTETGVKFINSYIKDISGGGVCVNTEEKLEMLKIIESEVFLQEDNPVRFYGDIVRTGTNAPESKFRYFAGVAFRKIEDRDREAIIRFVFEQQRKLRKKGLI
jgi:c-di-GMP-binding flagellar brake protein YcgR